MVSYYNSLAMFPQTSRPGQPSTNPSSLYSSYPHPAYNQYGHDQNSNLQLYSAAAAAGFPSEFGGTPPSWAPHSWSQFPSSCRNYDWGVEPPHPPPTTTPTSDSAAPPLHSPHSPGPFTGTRQDTGGSQSPAPSDYTVPGSLINSTSHYKPSLSPSPASAGAPLIQQYKQEPPCSTSDLGLPSSPSVSAGAPPNISIGSSLEDDCPSPSPLGSRPGPARSPFEWMKKASHPSPPGSNDPNGKSFSRFPPCHTPVTFPD